MKFSFQFKLIFFGVLVSFSFFVVNFFYSTTAPAVLECVKKKDEVQGVTDPTFPNVAHYDGGQVQKRFPNLTMSSSSLFVKEDFLHRKYLEARLKTQKMLGKPSLHGDVVFLTYATHGGSDDRFCRCVESVMYHGYRYHLLGWGMKLQTLSDKIFGALVALRRIPDETIVVFADAYDVLVTGFQEEVKQKFLTLGSPIVFGVEKNCWPFGGFRMNDVANRKLGLPSTADGSYLCKTHYPPSPTYQRYLNSGVWIGRAKEARVMCQELKNRLQNTAFRDDQEHMTYMFWEKKFNISLDYHSLLVKSMHESERDWEVGPHRFVEKNLKSEPVFWHFNGGGKLIWPLLEAKLFYNRQRSAGSMFWNDDENMLDFEMGTLGNDFRENDNANIVWETKKFSDICPKYVQERKKIYFS